MTTEALYPKVRRGRGPFFAKVPWELQDDPDADAATLAVYAAIQRYADWGGERGARVSRRTIAEKAGCSVRTVQDRLAWLRSRGWIEWESGSAKGGTSDYVVHLSLTARAADAQGGVQEAHGGGASDARVPRQEAHGHLTDTHHQQPSPTGTGRKRPTLHTEGKDFGR